MNVRRMLITAALGALLTSSAACGAAGSSPLTAQNAPQVGLGTALTVERGCSTDCGVADEPTGHGIVVCGWAVDDLPEAVTVSDGLASACDFRVTGEPCEEDELCAVAQIRETGGFKHVAEDDPAWDACSMGNGTGWAGDKWCEQGVVVADVAGRGITEAQRRTLTNLFTKAVRGPKALELMQSNVDRYLDGSLSLEDFTG